MGRDALVVVLLRALRAFAYGFLSVALAIYLKEIGYDEFRIGAILTASLLGAATFNILTSIYADRVGRRFTLILLASLMALSGLTFAFARSPLLLVLASLVGTINVTGNEVAGFLSVEQAILAQACPPKDRNRIFARYTMWGNLAGALGTLMVAVPDWLAGQGFSRLNGFRLLFLMYALIALASGLVTSLLSAAVEVQGPAPRSAPRLLPKSGRIVTQLSLLFAVDAFGGGFILQSIVSYWFFTRFGAPLAWLGVLFFLAGILSALSHPLAAWLADRFGLINTIVFTHIPSNVLLMLVPAAPTLPTAMILYLVRMAMSQMDVPTRQSYLVSITEPEERVAAIGITNIARNVAQSLSPTLAGKLMQAASLAAPFLVGGALKIAYDVALYVTFRTVRPAQEVEG